MFIVNSAQKSLASALCAYRTSRRGTRAQGRGSLLLLLPRTVAPSSGSREGLGHQPSRLSSSSRWGLSFARPRPRAVREALTPTWKSCQFFSLIHTSLPASSTLVLLLTCRKKKNHCQQGLWTLFLASSRPKSSVACLSESFVRSVANTSSSQMILWKPWSFCARWRMLTLDYIR